MAEATSVPRARLVPGLRGVGAGDLEGDGVKSTYVLTGSLGPLDTFELAPSMVIENEKE